MMAAGGVTGVAVGAFAGAFVAGVFAVGVFAAGVFAAGGASLTLYGFSTSSGSGPTSLFDRAGVTAPVGTFAAGGGLRPGIGFTSGTVGTAAIGKLSMLTPTGPVSSLRAWGLAACGVALVRWVVMSALGAERWVAQKMALAAAARPPIAANSGRKLALRVLRRSSVCG